MTQNKTNYLVMRKCERLLNMSKYADISHTHLHRATFYYSIGNYKRAIQICEHMISHWKPFVAYFTGNGDLYVPDSFRQKICGHSMSIKDKMTTAILVCDKHQGWRRTYIVLNLLAICLDRIGNINGAIDIYITSLKIMPNRNGASKRLDKLVNATCG